MSDKRDMPVRLIGLEEVVQACDRVAQAVLEAGARIDTVVAIARGGFMPARFICDFLSVSRLQSIKVRHYEAGAKIAGGATVEYPLGGDLEGRRVLLVDDVNDSGDTLEAALPYLQDHSPATLHSAVLHEKTNTTCPARFKAEAIHEWRWVLYPWAVTEDVGQFVRDMEPLPGTLEALRDRLRSRHGLNIEPDVLERVLRYNQISLAETLPK